MIELLLEAESALSLGLLDRAEILYRQVAGADPRNSIAVVGLARVLLERGDEPGALKQARRALAIDGENTAAQRMVQRLEEVLEHRQNEGLPAAAARNVTAPVVAVQANAIPTPAPGPFPTGPASGATVSKPLGAPEPGAPGPGVPMSAAVDAPDATADASKAIASASPAIEPQGSRSLVDRLLRRR